MNEGRLEVGGIVAEAERALAEGDAVRLAAAYASLALWADPHRAYQARCLITEKVLGHRSAGAGWVPMFATALRLLLDGLTRTPCEPVLLNLAMSFAIASIQVCWEYIPAAAEYRPICMWAVPSLVVGQASARRSSHMSRLSHR